IGNYPYSNPMENTYENNETLSLFPAGSLPVDEKSLIPRNNLFSEQAARSLFLCNRIHDRQRDMDDMHNELYYELMVDGDSIELMFNHTRILDCLFHRLLYHALAPAGTTPPHPYL